jgi:NADH-quinone oxidoreductase subunit G
MIEFEIDDQKLAVAEGAMVMEAADAAGIYIPRFCYHKKLSIAANCRMCLVEVEKSKKPLPACATPVTQGMKVLTRSKMAVEAQRSVMEFLLINHPLDCPICDQGGECELQDLSMGYGDAFSRYRQAKRSLADENLGPLISTEMTRCIQCTRCVRFGTEVAGMRELGATERGEDMRIVTYVRHTMQSELSGNIIDLCPVGALTSKPYRFTARAWELKQQPSVAPHDCIGSNIYVHTRGYEYNDYRTVMRVVPHDNEAINETWISDRDRFSYEGTHSPDRFLAPKIKRGTQWVDVDWATALNFIVTHLKETLAGKGAEQIAALASPSSTVEEFYLLQKLLRGLGSDNLDHRLRQLDFTQQDKFSVYPALGMKLKDIEHLDTIFLIGSDIRREQPLGCHRIRKASLNGSKIICLNPIDYDFNFNVYQNATVPSQDIPDVLAGIAKTLIANQKGSANKSTKDFFSAIHSKQQEKNIAKQLTGSKRGLLLLGNHAINHPQATLIRILAELIAKQCGLHLGYMSEGANSAGAWLAGMLPHRGVAGSVIKKPGLDADALLTKPVEAYFLLNFEPEFDCAKPALALNTLQKAKFVVVMSPFMTEQQQQYANVLLPIAPHFETSGTFVNMTGQWQAFATVTPPLGETRPAWKVLRVLGNLFELEGFNYTTSQQIASEVKTLVETMPEVKAAQFSLSPESVQTAEGLRRLIEWPMYQIDSLVRRATALQAWSSQETPIAIYINSALATKLQISAGEMITALQNDGRIDLPVVIDDRIKGNYVLIPGGLAATAGFGENFGVIELLRGSFRD